MITFIATSFFCDGDFNWWCANNFPEGQNVLTAVEADSCFCLNYQKQTFESAVKFCSEIGGFLSDIRCDAENDLLANLIDRVAKDDALKAKYLHAYCYSKSFTF